MEGKEIEPKKEYLLFLSRQELEGALAKSEEIKIEKPAADIIHATKNPNDIFAIYYTNPDIIITRAELITKENFVNYLKA
jgi:hypothetical protein